MAKTVTAVDIEGNQFEVPVDQLRWRPSAYAIVIDDGKLLTYKDSNGYDLPGGGIDLGELPEDGVIREAKEETGMDVRNPVLVSAVSSFFKMTHDRDCVQSIMLFYTCELAGGELSMEGFDEHEKLDGEMPEWLPLDKLDSVKIASSIDWRTYVREVTKAQE